MCAASTPTLTDPTTALLGYTARLKAKARPRAPEVVWRRPVPTFEEFVTSPQYLGQPPLTTHQRDCLLTVLGCDPQAVFTATDKPRVCILCWGKGSGKDLMSSYVIAYLAFLLNSLTNPQAYFQLAPGEALDIINVAPNAQHARDIFFAKLKERLAAPCMQQDHPHIIAGEVNFPKNIRLRSWHAEQKKWEGYNVIAFVMDEADAFRTESGEANADVVFAALETSAQSRFPHMRWLGIAISYPRSQDGFMMRQLEVAHNHPERYYGDLSPTWAVHPFYDPTHPWFMDYPWVQVSGMAVPAPFEQDFLIAPEESAMRYLAAPRAPLGGFFQFPERLVSAFQPHLTPQAESASVVTTRGDQECIGLQLSNIKLRHDRTYVGHGDPGLSGDTFAFAVGHTEGTPVALTLEGQERVYAKVVIDLILEWQPDAISRRPVDFVNAKDVILSLATTYRFASVTFDRWNSAQLIQELMAARVPAADLSFSQPQQLAMYKDLKTLIYSNLLVCYPHTRALQELRALRLVGGYKIDHPPNGSKDIADCLAAVAARLSATIQAPPKSLAEELQYADVRPTFSRARF